MSLSLCSKHAHVTMIYAGDHCCLFINIFSQLDLMQIIARYGVMSGHYKSMLQSNFLFCVSCYKVNLLWCMCWFDGFLSGTAAITSSTARAAFIAVSCCIIIHCTGHSHKYTHCSIGTQQTWQHRRRHFPTIFLPNLRQPVAVLILLWKRTTIQ